MNAKTLTVFFLTIFLIAILIWPTIYRYDRITIGNNTYPVKINRITGYAEHYYPGVGWVSPQNNKKARVIPSEECDKIKVTRGTTKKTDNIGELIESLNQNADFEVVVYNGSQWTVTEILFIFKTADNKTIKLVGSGTIRPFTTSDMSIKVTGEEDKSTWKIKEIRGYKG